eukprot:4268918-Prymnesium_polylepis.1
MCIRDSCRAVRPPIYARPSTPHARLVYAAPAPVRPSCVYAPAPVYAPRTSAPPASDSAPASVYYLRAV